MAQNVVIRNVQYASSLVSIPKSGGGNAAFVDVGGDTVDAAHLLQGYTAHDSDGNQVTGTYSAPTFSTQSKTATPTASQQTIVPDSGYDGLSSVTVGAIPSEYIVPSGSQTFDENGTYDVTALAEAVVDVPTGASNYVHGEFTANSTAGIQTVSIPYTGSGYPIMAYVVIKGGAYKTGTDWYNLVQRYAVGVWCMSKSNMSTTPNFSASSGAANQAVTCAIYKNNASTATSYTRTSGMTTVAYGTANPSAAAVNCVRIHTATELKVYVNTSSYGLAPGMDYEYFIVYSS